MGIAQRHIEGLFNKIRKGRHPAIVVHDGVKCVNFDFTFLPRTSQKLYVRKEYEELWDDVQGANQKGLQGFAVCGQPGIGKTLSLLYLLARGLETTQPFVFCDSSHHFFALTDLFQSHVFGASEWEFGLPQPLRSNLIALFDSNENIRIPQPPFLGESCLIVQAASPQIDRYEKWLKELSGSGCLWWMDVWTEDETKELQNFLPPKSPEYFTALELFHLVGPAPQTFLEAIEKNLGILTADLSDRALYPEDVSRFAFMLKVGKFPNDQQAANFHKTCFAFRRKGVKRPRRSAIASASTLCEYHIPTSLLRDITFRHLLTQSFQERINILSQLLPAPHVAGAFFEVWAIDSLSLSYGEKPFPYSIAGQTKSLPRAPQAAIPQTSREVGNLADQSNIIWVPPPGFEAVDAVLVHDGGRRVTLLQMTITPKHDIKIKGIAKILRLFPALGQNIHCIEIEFVFVVLSDAVGKKLGASGFLEQHLPADIYQGSEPVPKVKIPIGHAVVDGADQVLLGSHIQELARTLGNAKDFSLAESQPEDDEDSQGATSVEENNRQ